MQRSRGSFGGGSSRTGQEITRRLSPAPLGSPTGAHTVINIRGSRDFTKSSLVSAPLHGRGAGSGVANVGASVGAGSGVANVGSTGASVGGLCSGRGSGAAQPGGESEVQHLVDQVFIEQQQVLEQQQWSVNQQLLKERQITHCKPPFSLCIREDSLDSASARELLPRQSYVLTTVDENGVASRVAAPSSITAGMDDSDTEKQLCPEDPKDKALVNHLDSRREELSQMQWKLVRDQLGSLTEKVVRLGRNVSEIGHALHDHKCEQENALERMRIESGTLVEGAKESARHAVLGLSDRIDALSHAFSSDRSNRETSRQSFDRQLQALRDLMDVDKRSWRTDGGTMTSVVREMREAFSEESHQRNSLEDRVNQLSAFVNERVDALTRAQADQVQDFTEQMKLLDIRSIRDFQSRTDAEPADKEVLTRFGRLEERTEKIETCLQGFSDQKEKMDAFMEQVRLCNQGRGNAMRNFLDKTVGELEERLAMHTESECHADGGGPTITPMRQRSSGALSPPRPRRAPEGPRDGSADCPVRSVTPSRERTVLLTPLTPGQAAQATSTSARVMTKNARGPSVAIARSLSPPLPRVMSSPMSNGASGGFATGPATAASSSCAVLGSCASGRDCTGGGLGGCQNSGSQCGGGSCQQPSFAVPVQPAHSASSSSVSASPLLGRVPRGACSLTISPGLGSAAARSISPPVPPLAAVMSAQGPPLSAASTMSTSAAPASTASTMSHATSRTGGPPSNFSSCPSRERLVLPHTGGSISLVPANGCVGDYR